MGGLVEIRAFAEQVLFGSNIADKTSAPVGIRPFTDEVPGPALDAPPTLPGRPPELAFDRRLPHAAQFPGAGKLSDPRGRGMVLHYFANHELLALEVMALALLRFPDAPKSFRAGIARTMVEEQSHLKLYIERMAELGVTFGTMPVNSFFWRTMKDIATPLEYSAAMSLTFEQANLDFAEHYEKSFRELGDEKTADILRQIHDDEIRHVEHGVIWLKRFESEKTLWDAYREHLRFPLTPSRAKGPVFDEAGRARAGLDAEFISQLKVFSSSKGRPADLWMFNPGCERELAAGTKTPFFQGNASFIERDLAPLLMFLAATDDVVMVSQKPSLPFLSQMKSAGFSLPEFIETGDVPDATTILKSLGSRKLGVLHPWGETPAAMAWAKPLATILRGMPDPWPTGFTSFFSKDFAARIAPDAYSGRRCENMAEVQVVANDVQRAGHTHLAVKPVLGASGLGLRRIALENRSPDGIQITEKIKFPCIAEPWLDKICDLSVLFKVESTGPVRVRVLGITRPLIDRTGKYCGHALGRPFSFPDANGKAFDQDFFGKLYPGWMDQLREAALQCGEQMHAAGFSGPAGIDAMVFREPGPQPVQSRPLRLRPVVEINPRYSMGRVAAALEHGLARGHTAIWLHIHNKLLQRSGCDTFAAFAKEMTRRFPLETVTTAGAVNVKSGFLPTTDPEIANGILTALFAGQDAATFAWNLLYAE